MEKRKTGFWRGFTWKRFAKFTGGLFLLSFIVSLIFDYFDPEAFVRDNFTLKSLAGKTIKAIIFGFVCAVWFEPGIDNDKTILPIGY